MWAEAWDDGKGLYEIKRPRTWLSAPLEIYWKSVCCTFERCVIFSQSFVTCQICFSTVWKDRNESFRKHTGSARQASSFWYRSHIFSWSTFLCADSIVVNVQGIIYKLVYTSASLWGRRQCTVELLLHRTLTLLSCFNTASYLASP